MIDWSGEGRDGCRRTRLRVMMLCGGLYVGLVPNLAGMLPVAGREGPGATTRSEDLRRAEYESYVLALGGMLPASTRYTAAVHRVATIPAFARKYNLACSACHTAWPELNVFGQTFKDNGYQLGNDRDSPIWVNPSYIPFAIRTTPGWRAERTTHQLVDDGLGGTNNVEKTISQSGFDISGADLLMLGTLYKDISFGFVPTVEDGEGVGIEAAFVRFDNLFKSRWANLKVGKFEMDNMLSEKRGMMLSSNGAFYQSYHFVPAGDGTDFGMGDNQIGAEWLGHSVNSYTRFSVAVLGSTDGAPGLNGGKSYDGAFTLSQAFDAGGLGVERIGVYGYLGRRPTAFETTGGGNDPVPGTGTGNKTFYRVGAVGDFFLGNFEMIPFVMHASDDKALAGGTRDATWNSGLVEFHYYVNPQLVFTQRDEIIRMSRQSDPATPKKLGNIDAFTFGYRWYPIMFSRAGLAMVGEVSFTKTIGTVPLSGDGVGLDPLTPTTPVRSTSVLLALDFDF